MTLYNIGKKAIEIRRNSGIKPAKILKKFPKAPVRVLAYQGTRSDCKKREIS
jgi:hypothetical protein